MIRTNVRAPRLFPRGMFGGYGIVMRICAACAYIMAAGALCIGHGCAPLDNPSRRMSTSEGAKVQTRILSIGDLAKSRMRELAPVHASIDPARLMPETSREGWVVRTSADGLKRGLPYKLRVTDEGWTLTVKRLRRVYYRLDEEGNLVVTKKKNFIEDVVVVYHPPMVVIPARITRGARRDGQTRMVIKGLDGQTVHDAGTNEYSVKILGRARVRTPAGVFEAYVTRMTRTVEMRLADMTMQVTRAYVPGRGKVAEAATQRVTVLGLSSEKSHYRMERLR